MPQNQILSTINDLQKAAWEFGDQLIHDREQLTTLAHPKVKEIAAEYPRRLDLKHYQKAVNAIGEIEFPVEIVYIDINLINRILEKAGHNDGRKRQKLYF